MGDGRLRIVAGIALALGCILASACNETPRPFSPGASSGWWEEEGSNGHLLASADPRTNRRLLVAWRQKQPGGGSGVNTYTGGLNIHGQEIKAPNPPVGLYALQPDFSLKRVALTDSEFDALWAELGRSAHRVASDWAGGPMRAASAPVGKFDKDHWDKRIRPHLSFVKPPPEEPSKRGFGSGSPPTLKLWPAEGGTSNSLLVSGAPEAGKRLLIAWRQHGRSGSIGMDGPQKMLIHHRSVLVPDAPVGLYALMPDYTLKRVPLDEAEFDKLWAQAQSSNPDRDFWKERVVPHLVLVGPPGEVALP